MSENNDLVEGLARYTCKYCKYHWGGVCHSAEVLGDRFCFRSLEDAKSIYGGIVGIRIMVA